MSLTNKTIANTYKDILQVDNSNSGLTTIARRLKDGNGTKSALKICDDDIIVQPNNDNTNQNFRVNNAAGTSRFDISCSQDTVKALGQYVNTGVHQFHYTSVNSHPDTTDTWSALDAQSGGGRFRGGNIELGTGGTPATTYDVSGGNQADDFVQSIWHVPFNITIDGCRVWFGADTATGDAVKFSVMSYTISTANDATGGDLSAGVENCVSPSAIAGGGYDTAHTQSLTVSTANVDVGKAIVACVHQDGTNSDLTVNMQLIYHLRST